MYTYAALCAFVLITLTGVDSHKRCSDCMNYKDCPPAVLAFNKLDQESREYIRGAFCSTTGSGNKITLNVCCSEFPTAKDIRIANHPNLDLLPESCGDDTEVPRVVGGKIADLYEFPWMALIYHKIGDQNVFKCGGSIVNKRYILTAAHCVYRKEIAHVRVGEYDTSEELDCQLGVCEDFIQDLTVEKVVVHENYHGLPAVVHDIALIRVGVPMDFTRKNVQPICLPKTAKLRNKPLNNVDATVAGWGVTENGNLSAKLRKVTIPINTAERCYQLYNRYSRPGEPDATSTQLCAGEHSKDSCNGDSGGPLMVEERYNGVFRYVQYGVVSYARGQKCGINFPGVYTYVTKYIGWILDNMESWRFTFE